MGRWTDWVEEGADRIRAAGRWRTVRDVDGPGPSTVVSPAAAVPAVSTSACRTPKADTPGGRAVVSFASNDYLGLSHHPDVLAAAAEAVGRDGTGAGSARLVAGARPAHRQLEAALAAWKEAEAAVLFATGYMANVGVLQALGGPDLTIVSDRLNHASIVDGCRLSKAAVVVTPHVAVAAVEAAVAAAPGRVLVVTESVFSMDGDVAPLGPLVELCERHGALLVVDDAHAVLGPDHLHRTEGVLHTGTLSKALGSLGGFVAGPAGLCDLVVQRARSFVFTTASTPADTAAALAALSVVQSAEGEALLARLRANVDRLRPGHPSAIVPVVVGDEEAALAASAELLELGLLVPAIRPPTVPAGTSRLRISLSAAHSAEQVDHLAEALTALGLLPPAARCAERQGEPVAPDTTSARPEQVVLVLGTATGVGKTWLTAALARALRANGLAPAARKPVQSFGPGARARDHDEPAATGRQAPEPGSEGAAGGGRASGAGPWLTVAGIPAGGGEASGAGRGPTDAEVLAAATGEAADDVCPPHRSYSAAMAPPLAAEALGLAPFTLADLLAEVRWPPGAGVGLVEGVGGPRSPLATDADNVALAAALAPDVVVLVADAGLGAINAVLLAVDALPRRPVVFLNRFDPADPVHAGNLDWLTKRSGLQVTTTVDDLAHRLSSK